jgi:flagellar hook-length control protein FliK
MQGANRVTWVRAGAQQAEAGFEDPRLGWVSVRADVNGGAIHASLVPASADAAQVMGGHLDGLNAYLSEHHSTVETITLSAPAGRAQEEPGSQGQGMQQRGGQEPGQGSGQENGQETGNGYSSSQDSSRDLGGRGVSATSSAAQAVLQDIPVPSSSSGSRISLMA